VYTVYGQRLRWLNGTPHSPHCTGSYGHQEDPDIGVVVEFGEDCFPLGGVDVAVYSAKGDALFMEEFAHEVEASSPEGEDYAGSVVSDVIMVDRFGGWGR